MAFEPIPWASLRGLTILQEEKNRDDDPFEANEAGEREGHRDPYDGEVNILAMYLREMGKVPLLTRQREIELARRIQMGQRRICALLSQCSNALGETNVSIPFPDDPIEPAEVYFSQEGVVKEVIRKLDQSTEGVKREGNRYRYLSLELQKTEADLKRARAEMILANLRLVVSIAKAYMNKGLSFLDLLQEGNLGLMKAIGKYDYRRGYKFSPYASWWIRQAITKALADKSRTIRIPSHLLEIRRKISKNFHEFVKRRGREPDPEEIFSHMGIDPASAQKALELIKQPVSLETAVGDDSKLEDFIEGKKNAGLEDLIECIDRARKTHRFLSVLKPREKEILQLRFGIGEPTTYTLKEIGQRFGISRERVRQIERKALKKLRAEPRARIMYSLLICAR